MSPHLNQIKIRKLCRDIGLPEVVSLVDLTSTFSNDVQVINEKLILKSWDPENIKWFNKELFCLTQLQGMIPVIPKIIYSDDQGGLIGKPFMILQKLPGKTLIAVWEKLTSAQQREVISEICGYLRKVSLLDISSVPALFPMITNWQEWTQQEFSKNLALSRATGLLSQAEIDKITTEFKGYLPYLKEQKMQVMYYDIHFGNFLVNNGKLSGIVDFERTEWVSMDYCLNWIRRMMLAPGEYTTDKNSNPDKFKNLMILFKEYYPELFAFDHLEERLKAYALLSDLRILVRRRINHSLK